jgi:hypothetical protein
MFHEPTDIQAPQGQRIGASREAVNPENTQQMFQNAQEPAQSLSASDLKVMSNADLRNAANSLRVGSDELSQGGRGRQAVIDRILDAQTSGDVRRRGLVSLPNKDDLQEVSGKIKEAVNNVKDFFSIEAVPKLSREGVGDLASSHALAPAAVPHIVRNKLAGLPRRIPGPRGDAKDGPNHRARQRARRIRPEKTAGGSIAAAVAGHAAAGQGPRRANQAASGRHVGERSSQPPARGPGDKAIR